MKDTWELASSAGKEFVWKAFQLEGIVNTKAQKGETCLEKCESTWYGERGSEKSDYEELWMPLLRSLNIILKHGEW